MTEEIRKILDDMKQIPIDESWALNLEDYQCKLLLNYITNLQKENEKLKDNQVRALNKIKDYISAGKCETLEGNYSNDEHSQYWNLFNKQLKEIKKLIKGVNINQYINIPKYREKELLNKEEQLGDYKSRNEKAVEYIKSKKAIINTDYIRIFDLFEIEEQGYTNDLLNILEGGNEK